MKYKAELDAEHVLTSRMEIFETKAVVAKGLLYRRYWSQIAATRFLENTMEQKLSKSTKFFYTKMFFNVSNKKYF